MRCGGVVRKLETIFLGGFGERENLVDKFGAAPLRSPFASCKQNELHNERQPLLPCVEAICSLPIYTKLSISSRMLVDTIFPPTQRRWSTIERFIAFTNASLRT
eukprot:scaffold9230_cov137-Skeletonema_marinoi.AAC.7